MSQLEHIEANEKRLWSAADLLRSSSNYASNEYFLPVMGLVFLRHAYSRYLTVKAKIDPTLPSRGKTRALTKEDFSQQSAIYLRSQAQFDHLVSLPDKDDCAKAIIDAMESIEKDYDNLSGSLETHRHGPITTTRDFSLRAVKEAVQPEKPPVTLMNGEQLMMLVKQNGIGIHRSTPDLFEIDEEALITGNGK